MSDTFNTAADFDNLLVELQDRWIARNVKRSKEEVEAVAFDAMFIDSDVVSLNEVHLEHGAGARWCRQETA